MYLPKQDLISRVLELDASLRPIMLRDAASAGGKKERDIRRKYDSLRSSLLGALDAAPVMLDPKSLLSVQAVVDDHLHPFLREVRAGGKKLRNLNWIDIHVERAVIQVSKEIARSVVQVQGYSSKEVEGFSAELINSTDSYVNKIFDLVWSELELNGFVEGGVLYMSKDNYELIVNALIDIRAKILEYLRKNNQECGGKVEKTLLEMIQQSEVVDKISLYVLKAFLPLEDVVKLNVGRLPDFDVVYGAEVLSEDFVSNLRNRFIGEERQNAGVEWSNFEIEELGLYFGLREDMSLDDVREIIDSYLQDCELLDDEGIEELIDLAEGFNEDFHMGLKVRTILDVLGQAEKIMCEDAEERRKIKEANTLIIPELDLPEHGLPTVELIETNYRYHYGNGVDIDGSEADAVPDGQWPVKFDIDPSIPYDPENDHRIYTSSEVTLDEYIDPDFQIGLAIEWYEGANLDFDKFEEGTIEREIHKLYLSFVNRAYSLGQHRSEQLSGFFLRVVKPNIVDGKVVNLTLDQVRNFRENLAI